MPCKVTESHAHGAYFIILMKRRRPTCLLSIRLRTGQLEPAIAERKTALHLRANDADDWTNLGVLEARARRLAESTGGVPPAFVRPEKRSRLRYQQIRQARRHRNR